jgi:hypothetical protein
VSVKSRVGYKPCQLKAVSVKSRVGYKPHLL